MAVSVAEGVEHRHVALGTHLVGEKQPAEQQREGVTEGGLRVRIEAHSKFRDEKVAYTTSTRAKYFDDGEEVGPCHL